MQTPTLQRPKLITPYSWNFRPLETILSMKRYIVIFFIFISIIELQFSQKVDASIQEPGMVEYTQPINFAVDNLP